MVDTLVSWFDGVGGDKLLPSWSLPSCLVSGLRGAVGHGRSIPPASSLPAVEALPGTEVEQAAPGRTGQPTEPSNCRRPGKK